MKKKSDEDGNLLLASSEFRELSPIKKALRLIQKYNFSQRHAAQLLKISKDKIRRALQTEIEGHELERNGRPKSLNPLQEQDLLRIVKEGIQNGKPLSYFQFKNLVCILCQLFCFFFPHKSLEKYGMMIDLLFSSVVICI